MKYLDEHLRIFQEIVEKRLSSTDCTYFAADGQHPVLIGRMACSGRVATMSGAYGYHGNKRSYLNLVLLKLMRNPRISQLLNQLSSTTL